MIGLRLPMIARLAFRDLRHGWPSAVCFAAAVAVALLPLMLLVGLKSGIVTGLIERLRQDPRVLQLSLNREEALTEEFFDILRSDPRVGFVLPRARYLASSVLLRSEGSRRRVESRMVPTAAGDPLLGAIDAPVGYDDIVLSERTALSLTSASGSPAAAGDLVKMNIRRNVGDRVDGETIALRVLGVIPRDRLQTDDVLLSPKLEAAIEAWREGFAVPDLGWADAPSKTGRSAENRTYSGFRLYASDVRDVPSLRDTLLADGYDIDTRASEVERVMEIERVLRWVFIAVSALSGSGFLLTLSFYLVASVIEKQRELSVLRLLGLKSSELSLFPLCQGLMIAGLGAVIALTIAAGIQPFVNVSLEGIGGQTGLVSRLQPIHFAIGLVATLAVGAASGSLAGYRAAQIEPSRGLRHE